jgi:hypothetical protein
MAGVRLCAQSIFLIIAIVLLFISLNSTDLSRYFGKLITPTLPLVGTDVFQGIDTNRPINLESYSNIRATLCDKRSVEYLNSFNTIIFQGPETDEDGRTVWYDSERPQSMWEFKQTSDSVEQQLHKLFIHGINLYGCDSSTCSRETSTLSSGFSKLHVNIVLAVEQTRVFHSSRERAELAAFHIQDALRVFGDVFSINVALRVVRNVNWQPFMTSVGSCEGDAAERATYTLSTEAMRLPIKGAPFVFPLDELLGFGGDNDGNSGCGVDCRIIDLILYQHSDHNASVLFADGSDRTCAEGSPKLTSLLVGDGVGISVLDSHQEAGSEDDYSAGQEASVAGVVGVLLDQLRNILGADVKQWKVRSSPLITEAVIGSYLKLWNQLESSRKLVTCENVEEVLSAPLNNRCPLLCNWESRMVVAASALLMHTHAVDSLEKVYRLMSDSSHYLLPSQQTRETLDGAASELHLSATCKARIRLHPDAYRSPRTVQLPPVCDVGDHCGEAMEDEMGLMLRCMVQHSSAALRQAHSVLYDPQIGRDIKDGGDFLTALFLPYWLPVLIPLLFGFGVEVKRFIKIRTAK